MDHQTLKEQSLEQTADLMEAGTLPYPPVYTDEYGNVYPAFPDALRMVAEAAPPERCVNCGKPGYYYPADKAYAPGHCYSENGKREFTTISSCCEFCFDHMFAEPEEDEDGDS